MLRRIFLLGLLISGLIGNTQAQERRLFRLFANLPDTAVIGLTTGQRQELIQNFRNERQRYQQDLPYRLHTVDHGNGFLGLDGAFEGVWQMCYWNLSDGRQLICTYAEGCGPVCQAVQFDFYYHDQGKITHVPRLQVIPEFVGIEKRFLRGAPDETYRIFNEKDIIATVVYRIPRRGKNITIVFGNEEPDERYRPYVHGTKIDLIWQDGRFTVGEPY